MKSIKLLLCVLIGLLFACNDDDLFEQFSDPDYPTRYCVLSDIERNQLFEKFNHNLKIYFEVDSFGYLEQRQGQKHNSELFLGKINSKDSVLNVVNKFISNNTQLYGINNTSLLKVSEIKGYWVSYGGSLVQEMEEDRNRWYLRFENQLYDNIEIYNTPVGLYISPTGVYQSYGHWYPEIYLPPHEDVSFEDAKQELVGKTFGYYDWTGSKTYKISEDDFYADDSPQKMIIPHREGDCIEMRLCWKVESKAIWNFYVDVMSGGLIMNEQTIIF